MFGRDRPVFARRAIAELKAAREDRDAHPHDDGTLRRLRAAEAVRAIYGEYGDTFTGH